MHLFLYFFVVRLSALLLLLLLSSINTIRSPIVRYYDEYSPHVLQLFIIDGLFVMIRFVTFTMYVLLLLCVCVCVCYHSCYHVFAIIYCLRVTLYYL